jgi:hypothetical protein
MACSAGFPAEKVRARNHRFYLKVLLSMPSRKSLIILLAFLFAAALPASAQATKTIRGPGYRSHVPSGWKVKSTKENAGWRVVRVTPPGRATKGRNSSTVVIGTVPIRTLEKAAGQTLPASDIELAKQLAAVPRTAQGIQPTLNPQPSVLAGDVGGIVGYHYVADGIGTTQTATVVRRHGRVYLLQVVSDDSVSFIGTSAVGLVRANWRWR